MVESQIVVKLERRIKKLERLLDQREDIAEDIIKEEIVDDIKNKMFAEDYSLRIIDNVEVRDVKVGRKLIHFKIFNELIVGDGFDIALGMEKGIRPHDIFGSPLAFPGKTIIGTPATVFATHVRHPGVRATHIIRDTVQEKTRLVETRYRSLMKEKIQQIRNSS